MSVIWWTGEMRLRLVVMSLFLVSLKKTKNGVKPSYLMVEAGTCTVLIPCDIRERNNEISN